MTHDDIIEYKKNAVKHLERASQFATARAVEQAFSAMICLDQYRFERDVAVSQLSEIGVSLGEKMDGVYIKRAQIK